MKKCEQCSRNDTPCKKEFFLPLICISIKTFEQEELTYARAVDNYFRLSSRNLNAIWLEDILIFGKLDKEIAKKYKHITEIVARMDMQHKFSITEDYGEFKYNETKRYYENIIGEFEKTERKIIVIENGNEYTI